MTKTTRPFKVFTCNTFKGHWPVGTSAVIIADSEGEAAQLLLAELVKRQLPQEKPLIVYELDMAEKRAIVLQDGEY